MSQKLLTILIPTVPQRETLLSRLLSCLESQLTDEVEVLIYKDECVVPYGDKINHMVSIAKGEYIVCIDDDDFVPDWYIETILKEIKNNHGVDFIGYRIAFFSDGKFEYYIEHNYEYKDLISHNQRGISPKCIIKKSVFENFKFGNEYQSDQIFSHEVEKSGLIKNYFYIDEPLYFYDFWLNNALGASNKDKSFIKHINTQRRIEPCLFRKDKFIWI